MQEHIKVGREYPEIDLNTSYSFGLDDQEFVVAFETDDPRLVPGPRPAPAHDRGLGVHEARHADVHVRVDVGRAGAQRARRRRAAGLAARLSAARERASARRHGVRASFSRARCRCRSHDPASCRALPPGDAQRFRRAGLCRPPPADGHPRRRQVRPSQGRAGREGRAGPVRHHHEPPLPPGRAPGVRPPLLGDGPHRAPARQPRDLARRRVRRPRGLRVLRRGRPCSRASPRR